MPRLDLNLKDLAKQRELLHDLQAQQRALDSSLAAQRRALEAAQQSGAAARVTAKLSKAIDAVRATRQSLVDQIRKGNSVLDRFADDLIGERDPAAMAAALDGGVPIALLPMRLETRYAPDPNTLRIRVYPDDLNIVEHTPALTDKEKQSGTDYWRARFSGKPDETARIVRDLSSGVGRNRCAWVLRVLTPENAASEGQQGVEPQFPDAPVIDAKAKQTRALLLPDRWCAIGYAAGRREVFRVWGNRIPDELILSPDWLDQDAPEALLGGERAWLVDFDAALAKGMALQVTQEMVTAFIKQRKAAPFKLAVDTLERLVVIGLEWTREAPDTAAGLGEMLAAQADSEGLAFMPLDTPTNNTEAAPSGYSPAQESTPPPSEEELAQLPQQKDALELLTDALGLPGPALPAQSIDNAHLAEQRTAMHMMNALWRATFGHYLMELWNPPGDEQNLLLKTPTLYALRSYVVSYLRPAGPLPLLRVGKQPYGVLPVTGKRFVSEATDGIPAISGVSDAQIEQGLSKILPVLRPLWELACNAVPLLTDGDVDRAKDILQTSAWSQTAAYRNADNVCLKPVVFDVSGVQGPSRQMLVNALLNALGVDQTGVDLLPILTCAAFPPDPPYSAASLAGVPWVLADAQQPTVEAPPDNPMPEGQNYLSRIADALNQPPDQSDAQLSAYQAGPALLQALAACSVQFERHDAVQNFAIGSAAVRRVESLTMSHLMNVEPRTQNEAEFSVNSPKELAAVVIPAVSGRATLGEHVAKSLATQPLQLGEGHASTMGAKFRDAIGKFTPPLRNAAGVQVSLAYLANRPVGELNVALRTTLDAFSYRLDAWYTARASRRLQKMRATRPTGVHVGGYAWVENLKCDPRPDSDGYLLAPSLGQAASAAILRSGFLANHEQGAFNINLDSRRTNRALGILQGLTRDQPLAALYGYRIERGLRDALLGKLIWPLRLAYPWRPAGENPTDEPQEAVGARNVVDGVALLAAWQASPADVKSRVQGVETNGIHPFVGLQPKEQAAFEAVLADATDLADAVSDLLMAEGMHQIVQGNFERASAAMAVADKQALPIEPRFAWTPRGGASYTQRFALLCPPDAGHAWPDDRRARAEPSLNAWLAFMLGEPKRYVFSAQVHRGESEEGHPAIDANRVNITLAELGYSPLSAMLESTIATHDMTTGPADTGLRGQVVKKLIDKLDDRANVTGLDIMSDGDGTSLGLAHFEAFATVLRALVDRARPATRKDFVVPNDEIEKTLPAQGEYPGVDLGELRARAGTLIDDFEAFGTSLADAETADELRAALEAHAEFLPPAAWPPQVLAVFAPNADGAALNDDMGKARSALAAQLGAKLKTLKQPPPLLADHTELTHAQRVQQAIDQIKLLLGHDFPVLPRFALGPYADGFSAALGDQSALTANDPWRVTGWMTTLARVREGLDRYSAALTAHETLVELSAADDFRVVQFPHVAGEIWAALPEAWQEPEGVAFDPNQVPEELRAYIEQQGETPYKDINRVVPKLALALHTPGGLKPSDTSTTLAGLVCDDWPEFIPDRYQTAAIAFHYDAPGARPPQSILLAVPPQPNQENWDFDDVLDALHEAFDLARLRAVRPRDLGSGLGLLLPGNYLPHDYTGDLPGVRALELAREAMANIRLVAGHPDAVVPLGKV
ncbi:hypothetical protein ACQKRQ_38400 [Paraburkholderia sp. NPDC080076]|uniref:hypothetical protein n=1 Tax=Paraburkholderia sp. NPDC080076 TaxID=3390605 RepID=UPI003CFF2E92